MTLDLYGSNNMWCCIVNLVWDASWIETNTFIYTSTLTRDATLRHIFRSYTLIPGEKNGPTRYSTVTSCPSVRNSRLLGSKQLHEAKMMQHDWRRSSRISRRKNWQNYLPRDAEVQESWKDEKFRIAPIKILEDALQRLKENKIRIYRIYTPLLYKHIHIISIS